MNGAGGGGGGSSSSSSSKTSMHAINSLPVYCKWKNEKIFLIKITKKLSNFLIYTMKENFSPWTKASSTSKQKFLKTENFLIRFEKIDVHT